MSNSQHAQCTSESECGIGYACVDGQCAEPSTVTYSLYATCDIYQWTTTITVNNNGQNPVTRTFGITTENGLDFSTSVDVQGLQPGGSQDFVFQGGLDGNAFRSGTQYFLENGSTVLPFECRTIQCRTDADCPMEQVCSEAGDCFLATGGMGGD